MRFGVGRSDMQPQFLPSHRLDLAAFFFIVSVDMIVPA
jgi:hypothetical protein